MPSPPLHFCCVSQPKTAYTAVAVAGPVTCHDAFVRRDSACTPFLSSSSSSEYTVLWHWIMLCPLKLLETTSTLQGASRGQSQIRSYYICPSHTRLIGCWTTQKEGVSPC